MTSEQTTERDGLTEALRRIEAERNVQWQEHLRDHPYADGKSCPRCYGVHDAFASAANIVREVLRTPPGEVG